MNNKPQGYENVVNKHKTSTKLPLFARILSSTHLSEADGLDDVLVCQCEDLVSTHRIPHLSENKVTLSTQKQFGTNQNKCIAKTPASKSRSQKRQTQATYAVKSAAAVAALVASVLRVAPQTAPL